MKSLWDFVQSQQEQHSIEISDIAAVFDELIWLLNLLTEFVSE